MAVGIAHRRHGDLDRPLAVAVRRNQHRAPPEVDARARRERLPHRVARHLAVALVDQLDHLTQGASQDLVDGLADELLARGIDVNDAAVDVRREHAFGQ
jgi:hypothetical protein